MAGWIFTRDRRLELDLLILMLQHRGDGSAPTSVLLPFCPPISVEGKGESVPAKRGGTIYCVSSQYWP